MNTILFSIIIVSYENLEIIIECLDSIYKYNDIGEKLEVIVVDNSPNDEIYDFVKKKYKNVKAIKNDNKGFGQGNNVGVRNSTGKYLLFLNPDTILVEPILQFAIKQFNSKKELGIFGVKMLDRNLNRNISFYMIDKHGVVASLLTKLCNKLDIFIDKKMFIIGANLFVRREAFIQAGMFDEKIFMYNEEPDLMKRILKSGYKSDYFKTKSIIHLEGGTSKDTEAALKRKWDAELYYSKKYNLDFLKTLRKQRNLVFIKYTILKVTLSKNSEKKAENLSFFNEYIARQKNQ